MTQPSPRIRSALDLLLLLCCLTLALHFRLEMLDAAAMGSDSVGPYLKAYLIYAGKNFFPLGPFPESGYLTPYSFVPYLEVGRSLRGAMEARFCWNALAVLPLYLALSRVAAPSSLRIPAPLGLAGALIMALAPGLADTLLTGYQTFDVPLYATLPTAGALWLCFRGDVRAAWLIIPLLPFLAMLHPYAIVYAFGALFLVVLIARQGGIRVVVASSAVAGLVAAPQLYRYWTMARGRVDTLKDHLWDIAHSPGQFDSLAAVLVKAAREEMLTRDLFPHGLMLAAPLLLLLLVPLLRWRLDPQEQPWIDGIRRFSIWALLVQAAMIGVASVVRYLQPYHLRILYPPMAASVALLLAALAWLVRPRGRRPAGETRPARWPDAVPSLLVWVGCGLLAAAMLEHRFPPPPPSRSTLLIHEALSRQVTADATSRPMVIEFVHLTNDIAGHPGAIALDQLLSGVPEGRFVRGFDDLPQARYFLGVTGTPALLEQVAAATTGFPDAGIRYRSPDNDLALVRLDGLQAIRAWSARLCRFLPPGTPVRMGGANDYLGLMNPEHDTTMVASWFDACLWRDGP